MSQVSRRGQVTVPKEIRERFGLGPGTDVEFVVENGRVVLRRVDIESALERWAGALDLPEGVDAVVAAQGQVHVILAAQANADETDTDFIADRRFQVSGFGLWIVSRLFPGVSKIG